MRETDYNLITWLILIATFCYFEKTMLFYTYIESFNMKYYHSCSWRSKLLISVQHCEKYLDQDSNLEPWLYAPKALTYELPRRYPALHNSLTCWYNQICRFGSFLTMLNKVHMKLHHSAVRLLAHLSKVPGSKLGPDTFHSGDKWSTLTSNYNEYAAVSLFNFLTQ